MIPRFRVWDGKKICPVCLIRSNSDGSITVNATDDPDEWYPIQVTGKYKSGELMMSTGLKDKNDVEIYTEDVLKFKLNTRYGLIEKMGVVRCESIAGGCVVNFLPAELDGIPLDSDLIEPEVIGNIYENPKPLEGPK